MSCLIIPNRRSSAFHPFSLDVWDPSQGFPFPNTPSNIPNSAREISVKENTSFDWKETREAHIFKVDVLVVRSK
ncbi:hypothetical protein VitviT2T_000790 [Vitis vinifera]|uniref:Uncharacterized protein n=2 Tax=Vitis vinifera TaxID=29760 RepID=A0ABY9BDL1_VITVI|nr:hypothetical protein VitviT2T_000790 [Vitis vinifera]